MRILLTNDDGIHAEGLAALERIARQLSDDVWVVAPEHDQSGFAHSLSLSDPLQAAQGRRKALCRARHADRLRHHGLQEDHARFAGPHPVRRQFGLEHRRRRHLFRHHRRRHGRHHARHPLLCAEPGLPRAERHARRALGDRRGAGAAAARPAAQDRSAARRPPQHQFPELPARRRGRHRWSPPRAS